jgi:cytochrome o ubiquinol oxidase subunit 2
VNKTHGHLLRLFYPHGVVSVAEYRFMIIDVVIMLAIIIPTAIFIGFSLWRFRLSRKAKFDPDFTHSVTLEIFTWGVPFTAVVALAYFSWQGVFRVNPYAPTSLVKPGVMLGAPPTQGRFHPLVINVVATDWQWLFIYPKQGIATLNTVDVPAGRNVKFRLTATDVMNDFYIPQLVGMIDVMPGMRTLDLMRIDHTGTWHGRSFNFSGAGFSWMRFPTHVLTPAAFKAWVAQQKAAPHHLSYARFTSIARPTVNLHPRYASFSHVAPHLFMKVIQAAEDGVTYTTPMSLTAHMVTNYKHHAGYLTDYAHTEF